MRFKIIFLLLSIFLLLGFFLLIEKDELLKENTIVSKNINFNQFSTDKKENKEFSIKNGSIETKVIYNKEKPRLEIKQANTLFNITLSQKIEKNSTINSKNISLNYDNQSIKVYDIKTAFGQNISGIEFEIVLNQKPKTNKFEFNFTSKDLEFAYQPSLNTTGEREGTCSETRCWNKSNYTLLTRPEHIVGSYAVFNKNPTFGQNGKIYHIYRPQTIDANGNKEWANLNITDNVMTVTVPQSVLDNAKYPLIVDPTIGYTTIGGSSDGAFDEAILFDGTIQLPSQQINVTTIFVYMDDTSNSETLYGFFYNDSNGNSDFGSEFPLGNGSGVTTTTDIGWLNDTTVSQIFNNESYIAIGILVTGFSAFVYYDSSTSFNAEETDTGVIPNPWATGATARSGRAYSIYFNYSNTTVADTTSPTFSDIAVNTTINATLANFSVIWNDETNLTDGGYIFTTNNSGTFVNDSFVAFTTTPSPANVEKTLNATVGNVIAYGWYGNDTENNVNYTGLNLLTITAPVTDSCTYTSGDWNIDCSDNCSINSNTDIGGNNLSISGTGVIDFLANITGINNFYKHSTTAQCKVNVWKSLGGGLTKQ